MHGFPGPHAAAPENLAMKDDLWLLQTMLEHEMAPQAANNTLLFSTGLSVRAFVAA